MQRAAAGDAKAPRESPTMKMRAIVTAVAAAIILAACSGGAQPVPLQQNVAGAIPRGEGAAPQSEFGGASLVYVSDDAKNIVAVFERNGTEVAAITDGLNYPQGLYVDGQHHLWVANRGASNVLEFARGGGSLVATLNDDGQQPEGVARCPDGTVYVANIMANSGGGGNVRAYAAGHANPTRTLTFQGGYFFFPACDAHGNLFVTLVLGTSGTVVEFPHGRQTGATMLPIFMGGNPAGITVDPAGNLLVELPGRSGQVVEYTESGNPTGFALDASGWNEIALDRRGNLLVGSTGRGAAAMAFPSGAPRHGYRSKDFEQPIGVAIDPGRY